MKKLLKIAIILQAIYCVGVLVALAFLPLYDAFYPSVFSRVCYWIGIIFTVISFISPVGLGGVCLYWVTYFISDFRKSKKAILWLIVSPIMVCEFWFYSIRCLVWYTGGA